MGGTRLALHAGAGAIPSAADDTRYARVARQGIESALAAGHAALVRGSSAIDAVVETVVALEDCEVFNAGRGSVLSSDGRVEMDASVMYGADRDAGAVAGATDVVNPVRAARAVMEQSRYVFLAGPAVGRLAREVGLPTADNDHFITEFRRAQLERAREKDHVTLDFDTDVGGTVGAVALDTAGHLAAATSTGGLTNKLPGRVSDSCQIGSGTWADDATCAVSGTGRGEIFIRCAFAHEIDAKIRYSGLSLAEACEGALATVGALEGLGGCVAVDTSGRVAMPFNTRGMPRGFVTDDGVARIAVHPEDMLDP
ncbi:MAG: isoaspartyl peptidase/L-asparaginase [Myxococcales bacterium]|nr:isoaspartyl peptidase/L-asparaginase [Myxococcales bacterium]